MPLIAQNQTSVDVVARPTFAQNYFTSSTSSTTNSKTSSASLSSKSASSSSSSKISVQPNTAIDLKDSNNVILLAGIFIVVFSIFLTLIKYRSSKIFENKLSKLDV